MKDPRLIAAGLIISGAVFLAGGIYLSVIDASEKTNSAPILTAPSSSYAPSQNSHTSPQNSSVPSSKDGLTVKEGANTRPAVTFSKSTESKTEYQKQTRIAEQSSNSDVEPNKITEQPPYPAGYGYKWERAKNGWILSKDNIARTENTLKPPDYQPANSQPTFPQVVKTPGRAYGEKINDSSNFPTNALPPCRGIWSTKNGKPFCVKQY